jgi:phage terminase Nu1 subunit (DNA packaging protein)
LEQVWNSITRKRSDSPRPLAERTATRPTKPPEPPEPTRDDLPDYNESRARSEYEKANLLELERKQKEGQLLRREDVQQAWAAAVNITRTKLLGIPSVAKQRIPHLDLEEVEVLTGLLREALEELAAGETSR